MNPRLVVVLSLAFSLGCSKEPKGSCINPAHPSIDTGDCEVNAEQRYCGPPKEFVPEDGPAALSRCRALGFTNHSIKDGTVDPDEAARSGTSIVCTKPH